MKFNREKNYRRSLRLKDYDYTSDGAYFVTMCTWNRECMFGDIVDGNMQLNENGKIVWDEWLRTTYMRPNVELDEFKVMPNHFHGILILKSPVGARRCLAPCHAIAKNRATHRVAPTCVSGSLGAIIGQFKSLVTKQINTTRIHPGMPVWQRNYFERVIRNDKELINIRQYIHNNPMQWDIDKDNPLNI